MKTVTIRHLAHYETSVHKFLNFGEDLWCLWRDDKRVRIDLDEIDRADEEFEAFLLELLSAFQISIPELGTIQASSRPMVILTSNRTRELSDALKRRCLYHWVNFPDMDKEIQIVQKHLPGIEQALAQNLVRIVQHLRNKKLDKTPGIAETLDWARGLEALGYQTLEKEGVEKSLGCLLKSANDIERVKTEGIENLLATIENG